MPKNKKREIGVSIPHILKNHIITPFNAFNFAIGLCLAAVGAYEHLLYLAIILMNICIGIVQDIRSKRIVEKLSLLTAPSVLVIREGKEFKIPPDGLLAGEAFALARGDQICADATVLTGTVSIDESLLTGETTPVEKGPGAELLSGSFVVAGSCTAEANRVGEDSYAASITREAKKAKKNRSIILESLNKLVRFTGLFILPLGAILFYENYVVGNAPIATAVTTTSAALLGLLPKGLVLLTSVSLAWGVVRLGKRDTLVQELYGIEALARVDVLCMDKTGTLTDGSMAFERILPIRETDSAAQERLLTMFCHAFAEENHVLAALKRRFPRPTQDKPVETVSFSSERLWSAAEFRGVGTLYMGAPEKLLPSMPAALREAQAGGAHVLVLGSSEKSLREASYADMTPLFAVCLRDAVRPEAAEALRYFEKQNVRLMILSGDNAETTRIIAESAGLSGSSLDAGELRANEDYDFAVRNHTVFGRVLPEQKKELIRALQRQGHTVGMLGDGVNDVLAIRQADCGIAMASGCDAARRAARLVLMNNSFAALPKVVSEGRRVVNNIARVAVFFLTKTCFSFLLSLFCAVARMQYPFEPMQLSLYSIFFEAFPALLLTFRPNAARIEGDIVKDAVKQALPYAIAIAAGVMLLPILLAKLPWFNAAGAWIAPAWMCGVGAALALRVLFKRKSRLRLAHGDIL